MPKQKKIPGPPTQANGTREPKSLNNILTQLASKINKIRKTDGKADKPKISPMDYWVQRAKAVGLSDLQINMLLLKSEGALRDKVREIEKTHKISKTEKQPIELNTLELCCLFSPEPTKLLIREIKLKNGNYMKISTSPEAALPTEFDLNVLLATFRLALHHDFRQFTTTYYQIAKAMNFQSIPKTLYDLIKQSIKRLTHATIETNNWYNPWDKNRQYVALFHFYELFAYSDKTKKITIRFSQLIEDSIKATYLKNIDYDKALELRGYAKILYLQLLKLIGNNTYLELTEETVLRWLGKWEKYSALAPKRRNFYIKRHIDAALHQAVHAIDATLEKTGTLYRIVHTKKYKNIK